MTDHFERGCLLYNTRRYKEAEEEFRADLSFSSPTARAQSMLSLSLLAQDKAEDARKVAQQAITLDPDDSFSHYVLSLIFYNLKRLHDAENSIKEALRLNPYNSTYFAHAADIYIGRDLWKTALEYADCGLEIAPTDVDCLNCRTIALTKLGKLTEAEETIELALAREPENDISHANKGWILFKRGKPGEAAQHYREALRLNPNSRWAREGILEALKARNPVYYPIACASLWMSDVDRRASIFFAIILVCIPPLRFLMFGLCLLSYLAKTFFNLLLLTDPFGKQILDRDEKGTALLFACWLGLSTACIVLFMLVPALNGVYSLCMVLLMLNVIPLMRVYDVLEGKRRRAMMLWTALSMVLSIYVLFQARAAAQTLSTLHGDLKSFMGVIILLCVLSIFFPSGKQEPL